MLPGGPYPYPFEAYYVADGTLMFGSGCEIYPASYWDEHIGELEAKHGYKYRPLVQSLLDMAKTLEFPR
jgi:hypothetical protein